jgi:MFS family permease
MALTINRDSLGQSVAVTLTLQITASFQALAIPVLAPAIAEAEGFEPALIGYFTPLVYAASWAVCLFAGRLVGRFGPLGLSLLCIATCAAGLALFLPASLALMAVGAVLIGTGYGPITPASSAILSRAVPPRIAAVVFSIKQTGVPAGGVLAGLVVPLLMAGGDWRWTIAACVAGTLVVALLHLPFRRPFDQGDAAIGRPAGPLTAIRLITSDRALKAIVLSSMAFAAMQAALTAFLVTVMVERVAMSLIEAGRVYAVALGASVVARVIWGWVSGRWLSPRATLVTLALAMAVFALAIGGVGPTTPHWLVWAAALLFGATAMGWNGVVLSEVTRLAPPGQAGAATGASLVFTFGGVLIVPPIFTAVLTTTGDFLWAFAVPAAAAVAAALMLLGVRQDRA